MSSCRPSARPTSSLEVCVWSRQRQVELPTTSRCPWRPRKSLRVPARPPARPRRRSHASSSKPLRPPPRLLRYPAPRPLRTHPLPGLRTGRRLVAAGLVDGALALLPSASSVNGGGTSLLRVPPQPTSAGCVRGRTEARTATGAPLTPCAPTVARRTTAPPRGSVPPSRGLPPRLLPGLGPAALPGRRAGSAVASKAVSTTFSARSSASSLPSAASLRRHPRRSGGGARSHRILAAPKARAGCGPGLPPSASDPPAATAAPNTLFNSRAPV